jgi:hypothetical protein
MSNDAGWRKLLHHGGHDDCIEAGSNCWTGIDSGGGDPIMIERIFRTSDLPFEERKDFHDEDLKNVSEQINKLLVDVQKKKPDKRIAIMRVPNGLFIEWMPLKCPSPDDNVEKKELKEDSDFDHLRLK